MKLIDTVAMGEQVSHVAITSDGKRAVAAKFPGHKAALLAINGDKVTYDKQDIQVGWWPYNLDITPDGKLLLTADNGLSGASDGNIDTVTVIDLEAMPPRVIDKVVVGDGPEGFAISPDGRMAVAVILRGSNADKKAFFYNRNGSVVALKIDGKKVTRTNEVVVRGPAGGSRVQRRREVSLRRQLPRQRRHDPAGGRRPAGRHRQADGAAGASGSGARPGALTRRERPVRNGAAWHGCAVAALALAACGPAAERPIQGYIEGEYVRAAAPFAGALTQLSVKRGEPVSVGAPLFALERENEVALRRQSEQQLQAAQARLENLKTGKRPVEVETVAEQMRQAMATRDLAVTNLARQQKLYASGFVSGAVIDDARTEVKRDEAAVAQLQASVATAKLPARADEIRAAEADARAAREALAQADWRLGQRAIDVAPATGRVNDTYFVIGDWVPAGAPVVSLLPPANVKIRFYVPEPVVGRIKPGQSVEFSCDGCGGTMPATIAFISDRAEFTPPVLYSARTGPSSCSSSKRSRRPTSRAAQSRPAVDVTLPR